MSLRRADNASLSYRPRLLGNGDTVFTVGRREWRVGRRVARSEFDSWQYHQRERPLSLHIGDLGRTYWNYLDRWWWDNDGLTADEVHALLVTQLQRQKAKIERAQAMVAMGSAEVRATAREIIPDDVKQFVWIRDEGRCRSCGTTTELQFDHMIPVALGGNSASDNLQILCGPCNRRKGAGLTIR